MKRICYGISLPGLFVTITIYLHVSISSFPVPRLSC